MATKGKRYDKDFKLSAVKMVIKKGRSVNSVEVDHGGSYDTLQRWVKEFRTDPKNSFRGSGHLRPDEERYAVKTGKPGPTRGERHPKKGGSNLCKPPEIRYQFVDEHRFKFPVAKMCQVLQVSRSGYYACKDRPSPQPSPTS